MKYIIYKYKSPSNKYYIGITDNEDRRKSEHRKKQNNSETTKFARAIQKYGFDNLDYSILAEVETYEEANEKEIEYIIEYDSFENGYNGTKGGDWVFTNGKLSEGEVDEIRDLLEQNTLTEQRISELYDVSVSTISEICSNKRWRRHMNSRDIKREHLTQKGSLNHEAKLTEDSVREIKTKLSKGISRSQLVEEYNVSKTNIQMIATGESWGHVIVEEYKYKPIRNGNAKLDEDSVRGIWNDRNEGLIQTELATKYKVSRSTIQNILKGKVWKDIYDEMKE